MKATLVSIFIAVAFIGGSAYLATRSPEVASTANVKMEDGKQVVEITAKGKYSPRLTEAKAGVPTVIRLETNGTFDCTAQLTVPSVGFRQMLPPKGKTDIALAEQKPGSKIKGICSMGMYNFEVRFI